VIYELEMVLLEKRIGNKENPLEVNQLHEKLNVRFKDYQCNLSLEIRAEKMKAGSNHSTV
jgi:hypothetical protein